MTTLTKGFDDEIMQTLREVVLLFSVINETDF